LIKIVRRIGFDSFAAAAAAAAAVAHSPNVRTKSDGGGGIYLEYHASQRFPTPLLVYEYSVQQAAAAAAILIGLQNDRLPNRPMSKSISFEKMRGSHKEHAHGKLPSDGN
jgi:hypothetical protein